MDKQEITLEELHQLAAYMAQAIPDLDCPECCECGWVYHYIERSAELYREEWEWACLAQALVRYRRTRQFRGAAGAS
ncbi:hypothetical protein SAMN06265795_10949 [Noviherbaspirillum humi]|uniref:Uncharacterized protein n=1 Tax=Noviherbaspirillum humi TaxID=1688639 RepID=A0A239IDK0_9BURK|nr:hypothetical protein [Noviherbaspirillum humi]SNS91328.1 hypothetical protein SAMN06265795_10949 [Noviherbaspirillum humi]